MMPGRALPLALIAAMVSGCGGGGKGGEDTGVDTGPDAEDTLEEEEADVAEEDASEEEPACTSPPACSNAPADHEWIGRPCTTGTDCGSGTGTCLEESSHEAFGERYVLWPGGTCTIMGAEEAGCDPYDSSSCEVGSKCAYLGRNGSDERVYGCLDACKFVDTAWTPYDWNCGCREGYACSPTSEACFPGCSNDHECCEVWTDTNGDDIRQPYEVYFSETCENTCDGDDPDEYAPPDCRASFSCINVGSADADWHSECLFDADCPPDAYCRNIYGWLNTDGTPSYPGGICVKTRCELAGRGCEGPSGEDLGGSCVNLNTEADPVYYCWATCHTGYGPEDGDLNECRHADPDHPYTCWPLADWRFLPGATDDGYCQPAMVPSSTTPQDLYTECLENEVCASPLGLGYCYERMDNPGYCTARCSQGLAEDHLICGSPSTAGDPVPGVCIFSYCRPGCTTPHGDLGANGCPGADLACYPPDIYSETPSFDPAGTMPAGICFPACSTDDDCNSFWSNPPYTCNTTDGTCFD